MVEYQEAALDRTFSALADPTRRALVAKLRAGTETVSALAGEFPMSLQAVIKHLDVLTDAGLVSRKKTGRTVACALTPEPLESATRWIEEQQRAWDERLDRFGAYLHHLQHGVIDEPS
jgi:DNA-binding transcriptional ArsR family regulator